MLAHRDKWSYTVLGVIWLLHYVPAFGWVSIQSTSTTFSQWPTTTKVPATRVSKTSIRKAKGKQLRVALDDIKWEENYQRLLDYQSEYGHANVPITYNDGKRPRLGLWVRTQRSQKQKQSLSQHRVEKLDSISFQWKLDSKRIREQMRDEKSWTEVVKRLEMYKQRHGHANVPEVYNDGKRPHLGKWVTCQRSKFLIYSKTNGEASSITPERISTLQSLGFVWDSARQPAFNETWMTRFEDLKSFKSKYNTTKIPGISIDCESLDQIGRISSWAGTQRYEYKNFMRNETSQLTQEKIDLLNSIDFSCSLRNKTRHEKWMHSYFKLLQHHSLHNNTNVTLSNGYNSAFVNWVSLQKQIYHAGKLDQGKIDLLNELDFEWRVDLPATWEELFQELSLYKEKFNSTLVNKNIDKELGAWTAELRKLYAAGDLDTEWVAKLNSLDFKWVVVDVDWNAMCDRLVAYQKKHKTVCVPYTCAEDPPLGGWVHRMRITYKEFLQENIDLEESKIPEIAQAVATKIRTADIHAARLNRLLGLGFIFDTHEADWMVMYERLVRYHKEHNSTAVPRSYNKADPELVNWVLLQRYEEENISERRKRLLDAIGFVWDPYESKWLEMFERFYKYNKCQADNTNDPLRCKDDTQLRRWATEQRVAFRSKTLGSEREQLLNSIGFPWELRMCITTSKVLDLMRRDSNNVSI